MLAVTTDDQNNVIAGGSFQSTVDFDPGPTMHQLIAPLGDVYIYILKLDASGNYVWADGMGGTDPGTTARALCTDAYGDILATGQFSAVVDFDPGPAVFDMTAVNGSDAFVLKLDPAGQLIWVRSMGGHGVSDCGESIALDSSDNVFTAGVFEDTVDFDPGSGVMELMTSGDYIENGFVQKLDSAGNFMWVKGLRSDDDIDPCMMHFDGSSNMYVSGTFISSIDCDPSASDSLLIGVGPLDMFITKWGQGQVGISEISPLQGIRLYPDPTTD